jgi:DNA-directed RNA polymerase specialized sigma24 family protein
LDGIASMALNPEEQSSNLQIRGLLEEAVKKLPDAYRTVFMLRDERR